MVFGDSVTLTDVLICSQEKCKHPRYSVARFFQLQIGNCLWKDGSKELKFKIAVQLINIRAVHARINHLKNEHYM